MFRGWKIIGCRFLYLLCMLYAGVSILSTMLGLVFFLVHRNVLLLCAGGANLFMTRWFYDYGCAHLGFAEMEKALPPDRHVMEETGDAELNTHIRELHELEEELESMNELREDDPVDPWERQEYRRKIRQLIMLDPRLKEFQRHDRENLV